MSVAFNTSSEDLILAEVDTVLGDLLTLARQLIDLSASLPAEMSVDNDAAEFNSAELPFGSKRATPSGQARVPSPPQAYTQADMYADTRDALISFSRIEQVCSKFRRGVVESSVRTRVPKARSPFPATHPTEYSNSMATAESLFTPAPSMHADATFPFAYAQTRTIPSYGPSSAYGPASAYNPSSAFRPTPFGGYVPHAANAFADGRFGRANPLNGPPPNFGVFERWGSPAQRSTQAYTRPRHGPIARSKFTTSSNDVQPTVKSQTNSPANRVYNAPPAPLFIVAPAPRFPINSVVNPFNVDAFQRTPTATPRLNLGASAASPVARMPQAEASHETNANRGRPVFTNPFDNNKVILEDTWTELGSTTIKQDVAPVESPKSEAASGSTRPEETSTQNTGFGFTASSRTKIEGLDYNVPFEDIFDLDPADPRIAWWTDRFNEMRALGMI
ncbi:hypothetical protein EV421DRAFT_1909577 [Armillaria borealis]|uniref:Uncharacterized protein n=1 Tax=Armillaria borealis TaxID=47425 RepID=A0AA39J0W4_9AGAR|nr:hypothetical protein EV421DRAFT_1909577 [Armillaria borealis]